MLKIAKNAGLTDIVPAGNPITTQHPIEGSAVTVQVWLFNDTASKRYENVEVDPIGTDQAWVQLAPDNAGSAGTFLAGGAKLTFANIADTAGKPFWVRVTTPTVGDTQNKTGIDLQVNSREFAV
jgi:hypothetical protein